VLLASLILSIFAVLLSIVCISIMLAKNFFSTHTIQHVPVPSPFGDLSMFGNEMGRATASPYRDLDDPLDAEEREYLENLRNKKTPATPPQT